MITQTKTARPLMARGAPPPVSPAIRARQQKLAILIASGVSPADALAELEGKPRRIVPSARPFLSNANKPRRCLLGGREFDSVMDAAKAFEISESTARKLVTWIDAGATPAQTR